jgi:hypothetical protein
MKKKGVSISNCKVTKIGLFAKVLANRSVVPLCFFEFVIVIVNRYFFNFSFVSFFVSLI